MKQNMVCVLVNKTIKITGSLLIIGSMAGCGRDNSFIVNSNQDVQLVIKNEATVSAIKMDTSGNGDNSEAIKMSTVSDTSGRKDKLRFSSDLIPGQFEMSDFTVELNGEEVALASDYLNKVDKVGQAREEKSKACLESGYDTDYYYDDDKLVIYTLVSEGKQIVFNIEIHTEKYPTSKGATVGKSTRDDLYEMYGMPTDYGAAMFAYSVDGSDFCMNFNFDEDGVLASIDIVDNSVM